MGNQSHRERERLQEIGERAFRAVFDDAAPEKLEEVLGTDRDLAVEEGNEWGYTVGYDVGAVRVFWSAIQWKFDRRIADAVSSLIANTPDPGCVPDVMAAAVKIDRPYDLRDAVLARLARAMDRPEDVPEPVLQLQRAFQAVQGAVDAKGGAAGDPDRPANAFVGRYYTETLRGWIGGLLAGHREGMLDTLRRIIHERFGEWMTLAASIVLDERIDGPRAGVLASVLLDVSDPLGVLYWTEEIASMEDEELRQAASQGPPSGDDPVHWPWPPRRPPSADN